MERLNSKVSIRSMRRIIFRCSLKISKTSCDDLHIKTVKLLSKNPPFFRFPEGMTACVQFCSSSVSCMWLMFKKQLLNVSEYMLQMKRKFIPGSANISSHLPLPTYLCRYLLYPELSFLIGKTSQQDCDLQVAFSLSVQHRILQNSQHKITVLPRSEMCTRSVHM